MAHFAEIDETGTVLRVIVADQEFIDSGAVGDPKNWVQTSYNTRGGIHYNPETGLPSEDQSKALRMNFAGPGGVYDAQRDVFYNRQPFPSWTLDETTYWWVPPTPMPTDDNMYRWDEATTSWVAI